ncbi:MAG: flippase [Nanoarchaeota archaeon]
MKKSLGVGTAFMMGAEFAVILSAYVIHITMARYLGPELYGVFGVLMSLYLINKSFLGTGFPRAVSKYLAESKKNAVKLFKISINLQLIFSLVFALFYIVFAKSIATILKDLSLAKYIILLGVIVVPLSFFSLYVNGYMNGLRLFKKQAVVKIISAVVRVGFTILFLMIGLKIFGVLLAYLISIVIGCFMVYRIVSRQKNFKKTKESFSSKKLLKFAIPVTISALAFTLIRNINVLFIKSLTGEDLLAGLYTSASTLSNIPYMVFAALPATLMPSISMSIAAKNVGLTKKYISKSLRYLLLLSMPVVVIMIATSKELITLFYTATYVSAAPVLNILVINSILLSIFITLVSIITGSGKPKIEMVIILLFAVLLLVLNYFFVPIMGIVGAALASLVSTGLVLCVSIIYVYKKFKVLTSFKSLLRITLASIVVFIISYYWHYDGILLLFSYLAFIIIYFLLLFITGEINKEDINLFRKVIKF